MRQFSELGSEEQKKYGLAAGVVGVLLIVSLVWMVGNGQFGSTTVDTPSEELGLQPEELPEGFEDYRVENEQSLSWEDATHLGIAEADYIDGHRTVYTDGERAVMQKELHRVQPGSQTDIRYMSEQLPSDNLRRIDIDVPGLEGIEVWRFMVWQDDTESEEPAYIVEFTKQNVYVQIVTPDPDFDEDNLEPLIERLADNLE